MWDGLSTALDIFKKNIDVTHHQCVMILTDGKAQRNIKPKKQERNKEEKERKRKKG